jgi:hypothetical protein
VLAVAARRSLGAILWDGHQRRHRRRGHRRRHRRRRRRRRLGSRGLGLEALGGSHRIAEELHELRSVRFRLCERRFFGAQLLLRRAQRLRAAALRLRRARARGVRARALLLRLRLGAPASRLGVL